MAYVSAETKAIIAAAVKPVLAKYGMKGTLSVDNHRTIVLTLQSGPIDFGDAKWFPSTYPAIEEPAFVTEVREALKSGGWFDKSDIRSDYFHTAYCIDINVGRWNKPYIVRA